MDQIRRMVAWLDHGHLAVDGHVFDIGITTRETLGQARGLLSRGISPVGRGATHEQSAGNGTLMRILPLAPWHEGPDADLAWMAMNHSALIHAAPVCQVACALYCLWVRSLALGGRGSEDPFDIALAKVEALIKADPTSRDALDRINTA